MNARISILSAACGAAALIVTAVIARPPAPDPVLAPMHGAFSARLQPLLDGIGSTQALTPVPLGDVPQPPSAPPLGHAAKAKRHERAEVRP